MLLYSSHGVDEYTFFRFNNHLKNSVKYNQGLIQQMSIFPEKNRGKFIFGNDGCKVHLFIGFQFYEPDPISSGT